MNAATVEAVAQLEPGAGALWDGFHPMPRFACVSCSQCGGTFGAGDHGFSHCQQHPPYFTREQSNVMADERAEATRRHSREHKSAYLETTVTVEYEFDYGEKTPSPRVSPVGIDVLSIKHNGWDVGIHLKRSTWASVEREVERLVVR